MTKYVLLTNLQIAVLAVGFGPGLLGWAVSIAIGQIKSILRSEP